MVANLIKMPIAAKILNREGSMEISRNVYLERLIVRKHNGFIKVITGIRRCGKSYLLNTIFYNHLLKENIAEEHVIKFAFDSAEDLIKIGEDPLIFDNAKEERKVDPSKFLQWLMPKISGKGMYYLLLDEVQKLGAFESVLNGFLRKANVDVYVTGSNSKSLSKDILTENQLFNLANEKCVSQGYYFKVLGKT